MHGKLLTQLGPIREAGAGGERGAGGGRRRAARPTGGATTLDIIVWSSRKYLSCEIILPILGAHGIA
jgi:hypothetical protein